MMHFSDWMDRRLVEEAEAGVIIPFGHEIKLQVQPRSIISFDFDGTLTKWVHDGKGYHEVGLEPVVHRLKEWHQKGHRPIIVTHRTQELEGNPAFLGHGKDKMKVEDHVRKHGLPIRMEDIYFTHMGDKGNILKQMGAIMHYDDEMGNLQSVKNAGLIAVHVHPGYAPPKAHVAGDGQAPSVPGQPLR